MPTMPEDYQVPDEPRSLDAAYLRTCLRMKAPLGERPPELPYAIRVAHFLMADTLSCLGARQASMTPEQLAQVRMSAYGIDRNCERLGEDDPVEASFLDSVAAGEVEPGAKVVVRYRNGEYPGHYLDVVKGRILVLHQGSERKFHPASVRFPQEGEFPDVADNVNSKVFQGA